MAWCALPGSLQHPIPTSPTLSQSDIYHGAAAGEQEIDAAVDKTREAVGGMRQGEDVVVLPLYSSLPHHLQIKAIAPAGRHVRRKVRAPGIRSRETCLVLFL